MTYIPYLGTFFSHGTPVWPWPVIPAPILWVTMYPNPKHSSF